MSKLKICGTTNLEDALFCDQLSVDFLGFIFYQGSKRYITPEAAKPIIQQLKHSKPIGLFVDQNTEEILSITKDLGLWGIQIYQDHVIPVEAGIKVIRAISIDDPIENHYDYTLIDSHRLGGTGKSFDWSLLPQNLSRVFLAGGINANNIKQALAYKPFAIDLVSGVEAYPGKKDFSKIKLLQLIMVGRNA